jgi:hypothetical protein
MTDAASNTFTPDLTSDEAQDYRALLETAQTRAGDYRGGESQFNAFYKPLEQAEAFIRSKGQNPVPDMEHAFARAAGMAEDKTLFNDILQRAADAFNHAADRSSADLESMLALLEQGGAKIIRDNGPDFIPTAEGRLRTPKHANPDKFKRVFQPRLLWLVQGLESIGVYADDLVINSRKADSSKLRQTPFILIEIPRHKKQIILANQKGEVTFVADDRFELQMWERLNKYQLKTLEGVTPVVLRDKEKWLNRILFVVQGEGIKLVPKIDLTRDTAKRTKMSYSVALIAESLRAAHAATGQWAHAGSGLIQQGPLANGSRTWHSIDAAMNGIWRDKSSSRNGLTRENCRFKTLDNLKDDYGFNDDYTIDDIAESLRATHAATGQWAHEGSGLVEHGSLANGSRTWHSINAAMNGIWKDKNPISSSHGLTRENCRFSTLAVLKTSLIQQVQTQNQILKYY